MTRPRPLKNVVATPYRNSIDQQLTPRTPHSSGGSRTSRLEQGFSKVQLSEANEADLDDQDALQSAPLLASSSTGRFSTTSSRSTRSSNSKGKDKRSSKPPGNDILSRAVSRLPLAFGIFTGSILLILIVLSFTRPDTLHRYVGAKVPLPSSSPVKDDSHSQSSDAHLEKIHISPVAAPDPTPDVKQVPPQGTHSAHVRPPAPSHLPDKPVHLMEGAMPTVISYENYTTFPLLPSEYRAQCGRLQGGFMAHGSYWDASSMGPMDVEHDDKSPGHEKICSSTITYMLDGTVGLMADLALMAQAATLAHERNRTFFVDDTYWDRGRWSDHFEDVHNGQPGPEPGCQPPPANELVACPRTARHWVINARTAKYHFGHAFYDNYEDPYGHNLNRLRPIYESAGESLDNAIYPNPQNMELIQLAREEFTGFLRSVNKQHASLNETTFVATHVRRGDRKSDSYVYPGRQIPLEDYISEVKATWKRLHGAPASSGINPPVYLATDSPEAHADFIDQYPGEVYSLYDTTNPMLRQLASPMEYYQDNFDDLDEHVRIQATRGMIVDFAMVSGFWPGEKDLHPEAIVCAMSSSVCDLAAVGLGWEKAFGDVNDMGDLDEKGKRWVDVDERGRIIPVWRPFEMF
ncbi:hypothetical protein CPC08DRAFT_814462 [Agrocybe pediades]|nr:hypothetical protein CPC08DRAFT_814462 [Agrocybe pediades]